MRMKKICRPGSWGGVGGWVTRLCQTLTHRSDSPSLFLLRNFSLFLFKFLLCRLSLTHDQYFSNEIPESVFACLLFVHSFGSVSLSLRIFRKKFSTTKEKNTCLQCLHIFQSLIFIAVSDLWKLSLQKIQFLICIAGPVWFSSSIMAFVVIRRTPKRQPPPLRPFFSSILSHLFYTMKEEKSTLLISLAGRHPDQPES